MKGILFQQPIEFRLEAQQNEFEQGDKIEGQLQVNNRSDAPIILNKVQIVLAYGIFKVLKQKVKDPWEIIEIQLLGEKISLGPQEKNDYSWSFCIPDGCPITDKVGSLFILYGGDGDQILPGFLDLKITLNPILKSYLQTFETQFHFAKRYEKHYKGFTEVKLVPPASKEYPTLDYLLCRLRIQEGTLQINYIFKTKSLGAKEADSMKVVNKRRECQQEFTEKEYLSAGGFPNRQCFNKSIRDALDTVKPKVLF